MGFIKYMLIFISHFVITVTAPARMTNYSLYYTESMVHYSIGFPFNSITVIAHEQYLNSWNLLFDGNLGVGINIIQFLLNFLLTYIVMMSLFRWIEGKKASASVKNVQPTQVTS